LQKTKEQDRYEKEERKKALELFKERDGDRVYEERLAMIASKQAKDD